MIGVGGDPESKAALWANLNALFDKLCLLIWDLGDIELRQITVFATDLVADLLGCEYGVGLAKCVHAPIKIDAFTIRHDDERLHPDKVDPLFSLIHYFILSPPQLRPYLFPLVSF